MIKLTDELDFSGTVEGRGKRGVAGATSISGNVGALHACKELREPPAPVKNRKKR